MDERAQLFQTAASSVPLVADVAVRFQAAAAGDLAEADNAAVVRQVLRALVTVGRLDIETTRALIFELVLDRGLADPELAEIMAAGGVDRGWLRDAIRARAEELWPAVASEQGMLEMLVGRAAVPAAPVPWSQRLRALLAQAVRAVFGDDSRLVRIVEGTSPAAPAAAAKTAPRAAPGPPLPEEVDRALAALEQGLLERSVLPAMRRTVEAELGVLQSTVLPVREALGLGQLADLRTIVQTQGEQRLGRLVTTLTTGCIGVAGPRGAGKSTLLEALAAGVLPQSPEAPFKFRIRVAAPTRYDSREFLLHLTNVLCREVLTTLAPEAAGLDVERLSSTFGRRVLAGAALLGAAGLTLLVLAVAGIEVPAAAFAGGAAVLFAAVLGLPVRQREPESMSRLSPQERTVIRARQLLRETRYQLSFSSSTSTSVSLDLKPLSAGMGTSSERGQTRLPLSLPEVVALFREFVESISGSDSRTLVCIDELDKMATREDTEQFLNDVKAIFGISNCVFVLSVSEDALASFERRGLPARDAVDSAVDDVVRIEPLDWPGAQQLLAERVPRVPTPFWALCFAQTGGLARDLLRFARALFDAAAGKELALDAAALTLVDADVRNRAHGTLAELAAIDGDVALDDAATWLHDLPGAADLVELQAWIRRAPVAALRAAEGGARPAKLVAQVMTYGYLAATVLEVFGGARGYADFEQAEDPSSPRYFDRFAEIRRLLAVSPPAAWKAIERYRGDWKLAAWPVLLHPAPPTPGNGPPRHDPAPLARP